MSTTHKVTVLTHCKNRRCRGRITVNDVISEKVVSDSPQHLVVTFKCPSCGELDKLVGTFESWHEFKKDFAVDSFEQEKSANAFVLDIEAFDDVELLKEYWASLNIPPIREKVMNKCHCMTCKERYGTR